MAETVSRLCEKSHFLLQRKFRSLAVVNQLNTLDDLVVVFLDQALRPKVTLIVELWVRNRPNILDQVLTQAVRQSLNIILFSQLLHHEQAGLNPLVIVVTTLILKFPLIETFELIEQLGTVFPLLTRLHSEHFLSNLQALIAIHNKLD